MSDQLTENEKILMSAHAEESARDLGAKGYTMAITWIRLKGQLSTAVLFEGYRSEMIDFLRSARASVTDILLRMGVDDLDEPIEESSQIVNIEFAKKPFDGASGN